MELKDGSQVFVDTAPIIYFIEENSVYGTIVGNIFKKVTEGSIEVFTSVISVIEVLTKPYKMGKIGLVKAYKGFFYQSKGFSVVNINPNIAELTSKIRAKYGFRTPDAIQLAVYEYIKSDLFITNDAQLKKYDENRVVVLSEQY